MSIKVKLLVSRSGPAGTNNAGDTIDVSKDEAARMIEAGQAVPAQKPAKREKAVKSGARETRTK